MTSPRCPGWSGLREQSRDANGLRFTNGAFLQLRPPTAFPPPDSSAPAPAGVYLGDVTSLLLCKRTSVCSADDSTTHDFSLAFRGPQGDRLLLWDEDRYAGWDRDLDALDGEVRATALYLAQALGVELFLSDSSDQPPRPFSAPQLTPEQTHVANGDLEKALQACELTLSSYPELRPALRRKGEYLNRLGRYPEAIATFRKLLNDDPDDSAARLGLADSLAQQGQRQQAIDLLEEGIRRQAKLSLKERLAQLLGMDFFDPAFSHIVDSIVARP